jgi:hypothetical protein
MTELCAWLIPGSTSAAGGIELTGLEVTQGIQNRENSVVLIKDRPAFVRAHVQSTSGTVNDMTTELIGWRNSSFRRADFHTCRRLLPATIGGYGKPPYAST